MLRIFKSLLSILLICLSVFLAACLSNAPAGEESETSSTKGTKSANLTISETELQTNAKNGITTSEAGDYLLSDQAIETTSQIVVTLYNTGDVPAEKIKPYSLSSPLSYLGGSYPGTGGSCTKKIEGGSSCTLVLAFSPSAMGNYSSTFQLGYYNGKLTRLFEKTFKATAYSVPKITAITPAIGPAAGGITISFAGTQLFTGAKITIADQICPASYIPPTGISCVLPAHALGAVDVTVTNTDGQTHTYSSAFTYVPPPTVTSITPSAGGITGGTSVTIAGTNFYAGVSVTIGGVACSSPNIVSTSSITCSTGSHAAQTTDVVVTNADGQNASLSSGYTYQPAPTVSSISQSSGLIGGGEYLTITGTNFMTGVVAEVGGNACTALTRVSSTSLVCVVPSGVDGSTVDITVTNTDNQTGIGSGLYTYGRGESWTTLTTVNIPHVPYQGTGVWTGSKIIIHGGSGTSNAGVLYDPVTNSSTNMSTVSAPSPYYGNVAAWSGSKMIVWSGYNALNAPPSNYTNTGGLYDPVTNTWTAMTTTGAPSPRAGSSSVWTGKEMLIWTDHGGINGNTNTGALYDPALDSWRTMTTINSTSPNKLGGWTGKYFITVGRKYDPETDTWTAISTVGFPTCYRMPSVWTGSKLFVGCDRGYLYHLETNSWSAVTTVGAPPIKECPQLVWTGSRVIVSGDYDLPNSYLNRIPSNTGGLYNPDNDSWELMTTLNAASGRDSELPAIWTGKQMFIWGGTTGFGGSTIYTGGLYTPPVPTTSNSWTAMTTTGAPAPRNENGVVWTGSKMIVWGGSGNTSYNDGGQYDPVTNSWLLTTTIGAPPAQRANSLVWTGSTMIAWSGNSFTNSGGIYDPTANSWTSIETTGAPSGRIYSQSYWTGGKMIVWGGRLPGNNWLNTGGLYDPQTNSWSSMTTTSAALPQAACVWAKNNMICYGGGNYSGAGAIYTPATDTWSATTTVNNPSPGGGLGRLFVSMVWTGSKMIVWGGSHAGYYNEGNLYDPDNNSWTAMSTLNAPSPRGAYAVWTGKEMVVWGPTPYTDGGKYNPTTNTWTYLSTTNAPSARYLLQPVWTGSKMIIWGGQGSTTFNDGALYTP